MSKEKEEKIKRDIELQKIQALDSYYQARFSTSGSILVGMFIGISVLVLTQYYTPNSPFYYGSLSGVIFSMIALGIPCVMFGFFGMWKMKKSSDEFLAFIGKLLIQVEKGESLPSLMELQKQIGKKDTSDLPKRKRSTMSAEQRRTRREAAWLVLGVILGGFFGIIGGLWTAFYIEWLKQTYPNADWGTAVIEASIVLIVLLIFLFVWVRKQLKKAG